MVITRCGGSHGVGLAVQQVDALQRRSTRRNRNRGYNVAALADEVKRTVAGIVFQFDGSGDLIVAVDEQQRIIVRDKIVDGEIRTAVRAGRDNVALVGRHQRHGFQQTGTSKDDLVIGGINGEQVYVTIGQNVVTADEKPAVPADTSVVVFISRNLRTDGAADKESAVGTNTEHVVRRTAHNITGFDTETFVIHSKQILCILGYGYKTYVQNTAVRCNDILFLIGSRYNRSDKNRHVHSSYYSVSTCLSL